MRVTRSPWWPFTLTRDDLRFLRALRIDPETTNEEDDDAA